MKKQSAYSLLEMLIALSILTSTGFALYNHLNSRLLNLQQIRHSEHQLRQQRALYHASDTLNPLTDTPGPHSTGSINWEWASKTLEEQQQFRHKSGLYLITITPDTDDFSHTQPIQRLKMGYQK